MQQQMRVINPHEEAKLLAALPHTGMRCCSCTFDEMTASVINKSVQEVERLTAAMSAKALQLVRKVRLQPISVCGVKVGGYACRIWRAHPDGNTYNRRYAGISAPSWCDACRLICASDHRPVPPSELFIKLLVVLLYSIGSCDDLTAFPMPGFEGFAFDILTAGEDFDDWVATCSLSSDHQVPQVPSACVELL